MLIELLLTVVLVTFLLCKNINRLRGLPPGPTPWPFVGNVFQIPMKDFDVKLNEYREKYGGIFTVWLPLPTVVIADYEMLKRNVVKNGDAFAGRPDTFVMQLLVQGNYGLFFMENEWYKVQRKFTMSVFRSLGVGQAGTQDTISNLCDTFVSLIEKQEGPFMLRDYLVHSVGNVIHKHLFGFTRSWDEREIFNFHQDINDVLEHFTSPKTQLLDMWPLLAYLDKPLQLGIPNTMKANDAILDNLYQMLREHEKTINYDEEPTNYLDAYLKELKQREGGQDEGKDGFTEKQLIVALYDLYSAGMESIIIVIRFAFIYMLNNPEMQEKIHEELDRVVGRQRQIVMDDQKRLPYTCSFLQEVYRLGYVLPVNFLRSTLEEVKCEGYTLPKGLRIISQWQSPHVDEHYFADAHKFDPERFSQNGNFLRDEKINPFSMGKRQCPGEQLARMEVFIFFTTLVQKFSWLPSGSTPPPVRVITSSLRSPLPFLVRAKRRV